MIRLSLIILSLSIFVIQTAAATLPNLRSPQNTLPVFLGYTGKMAGHSQVINSMLEFERQFGLPPASRPDKASNISVPDFVLAHSLNMFWKNGGEKVQIISLGTYLQEGKQKSSRHFTEALEKLAAYPDPQLLVLPEAILLSEKEYGIVCREALLHGAKFGRFVVLDVQAAPGDDTPTAAARFRSLLAGVHLKEGAAYWPYVKLTDSPWIGPSGLVAGKIYETDKHKGVWKAPAGVDAVFAQQAQFQISQAEIQDLQQDPGGISINPLRSLPGKGIVVWGARTLAGNDNEWRYVPVRRLAILLERSGNELLQTYKRSPNTDATWKAIQADFESLLMDLFRKGAFPASKSEEAYFVKVGLRESMTQSDIKQGKIIVKFGFAPLKPAEFILLGLTLSQ